MPPMATGMVEALRVLHRTFGAFPARERAHVLARFLTCPYLRVLAAMPAGITLDIGAGHGILARLAAERPGCRVVAVEPDLRRTLRGYRHPGVRFVAGYDDAVAGAFDAVVMVDVLYKLPCDEWEPLFGRVLARLRPGGSILLKELDPDRRFKAAWNRVQESAANAVSLTLGRTFSYEGREQVRARLERAGFVRFEARDIGRGYPHAHVLYMACRPGDPGGKPPAA